jgi:hypothetical protein
LGRIRSQFPQEESAHSFLKKLRLHPSVQGESVPTEIAADLLQTSVNSPCLTNVATNP